MDLCEHSGGEEDVESPSQLSGVLRSHRIVRTCHIDLLRHVRHANYDVDRMSGSVAVSQNGSWQRNGSGGMATRPFLAAHDLATIGLNEQ